MAAGNVVRTLPRRSPIAPWTGTVQNVSQPRPEERSRCGSTHIAVAGLTRQIGTEVSADSESLKDASSGAIHHESSRSPGGHVSPHFACAHSRGLSRPFARARSQTAGARRLAHPLPRASLIQLALIAERVFAGCSLHWEWTCIAASSSPASGQTVVKS